MLPARFGKLYTSCRVGRHLSRRPELGRLFRSETSIGGRGDGRYQNVEDGRPTETYRRQLSEMLGLIRCPSAQSEGLVNGTLSSEGGDSKVEKLYFQSRPHL